jgi:hypothetical protein
MCDIEGDEWSFDINHDYKIIEDGVIARRKPLRIILPMTILWPSTGLYVNLTEARGFAVKQSFKQQGKSLKEHMVPANKRNVSRRCRLSRQTYYNYQT